jgi:DNA gyrase/topoisomerase IV subunit B
MTDADEDGIGHIRPLLLKFFLRYMPGLVLDGRLYSAAPPLYGGNIGNKRIYFSSDYELAKYLQKEFMKSNTLCDVNKKQLSSSAIANIILKNIGYDQLLENTAASFALEPHLLEEILNAYEGGYKHLKKVIESRYRFMKVTKENHGIIMVSGSAYDKIRTIPVDDRLITLCKPVIDAIRKSEEYYILNGETVSLYDLIKAFNRYKPKNIQRYKGLGEMTSEQLKFSTLHPDYDRTLLRYTIDDIKAELKEIKEIESDFSILLRDIRKADKIIV